MDAYRIARYAVLAMLVGGPVVAVGYGLVTGRVLYWRRGVMPSRMISRAADPASYWLLIGLWTVAFVLGLVLAMLEISLMSRD